VSYVPLDHRHFEGSSWTFAVKAVSATGVFLLHLSMFVRSPQLERKSTRARGERQAAVDTLDALHRWDRPLRTFRQASEHTVETL